MNLYFYKAVVTSIYDADTWTVNIDLGFNTWLMDQKLRLYGINAPEMRGKEKPQGIISRDWCRTLIQDDPSILLESHKDKTGKYGRWLATIHHNGLNVNEELVRQDLARRATY